VGRIEEKEGVFEIQIKSVWRGYTSYMTLILYLVTGSVPIYIYGEFQSIRRPPIGHTIQWGISDLQRLRGILEIHSPGLFLPSPDLSVGIFIRVIGHFLQ
jgi:hypothetical protein